MPVLANAAAADAMTRIAAIVLAVGLLEDCGRTRHRLAPSGEASWAMRIVADATELSVPEGPAGTPRGGGVYDARLKLAGFAASRSRDHLSGVDRRRR